MRHTFEQQEDRRQMKTWKVNYLIGYIDGTKDAEEMKIEAPSMKVALGLMELRRKELLRTAPTVSEVEFIEIKMVREQEG